MSCKTSSISKLTESKSDSDAESELAEHAWKFEGEIKHDVDLIDTERFRTESKHQSVPITEGLRSL